MRNTAIISARMPIPDARAIHAYATRRGESVNDTVRRALARELEQEEP
jgi:hypothetical protein